MFILGTMREGSTRVKDKMIRSFNGTSLAEIYLCKLEELMKMGFDVGCAVYSGDKTLWKLVNSSSVPVIERSRDSVSGVHRRSVELHFLDSVSDDNVLWLNGCQPFLKPVTVKRAIEFFYDNKCISITPVVKRFTWFWDNQGIPVNNLDPENCATQNTPPLYEAVHSFHIFPRLRLLSNDVMWLNKSGDPSLFVVDEGFEFFDIDTMYDYEG